MCAKSQRKRKYFQNKWINYRLILRTRRLGKLHRFWKSIQKWICNFLLHILCLIINIVLLIKGNLWKWQTAVRSVKIQMSKTRFLLYKFGKKRQIWLAIKEERTSVKAKYFIERRRTRALNYRVVVLLLIHLANISTIEQAGGGKANQNSLLPKFYFSILNVNRKAIINKWRRH